MTMYFLEDCQESDGTALGSASPVIDDSASGWTVNAGSAEINSNLIEATGASPGGSGWVATFDGTQADGILRLIGFTGGGTSSFGLVARYSNTDNFWYFEVEDNGNTDLIACVFKYKNGSWDKLLDDISIVSQRQHYLTIEVHLNGNDLTMKCNGVQVYQTTDSFNVNQTSHGLRLGATTYKVRQVTFESLDEPAKPAYTEHNHVLLKPQVRAGMHGNWLEDFVRDTAATNIANHEPDEAAIKLWTQRAGTFVVRSTGKGVEPNADELTVATQAAPSPDGLWECTVDDGGDSKSVGLAIRYNPSDGSFVMLRTRAAIATDLILYEYDGSSFSAVESWSTGMSTGENTIWIKSHGSELLVALNDTVIGKATTTLNTNMRDHGVVITGIGAAADIHGITRYTYLHPNSHPYRQRDKYVATAAHVKLFDITGRSWEDKVHVGDAPCAIGAAYHDDDAAEVDAALENNGLGKRCTASNARLSNRVATHYEDGVVYSTVTSGIQQLMMASTDPLRGISIGSGADAMQYGMGAWSAPRECYYDGDLYAVRAVNYEGDFWLFKNGQPVGALKEQSYNEYLHWGCAVVATDNGVLICMCDHSSSPMAAIYLPGGDYDSKSAERTVGGANAQVSYPNAVAKTDGKILILVRGADDTSGSGTIHDCTLYTLNNPESLVSSAADYTADLVASGDGYARIYPASILRHGNDVFTVVTNPRVSDQQRYITGVIFAPDIGSHGRWYLLDGTAATVNDALGVPGTPRFSTSSDLNLFDGTANRNTQTGRYHIGEITQEPGSSTAGKARLCIPYFQNDNTDMHVYENVVFNWLVAEDDLSTSHAVDCQDNPGQDMSGNGYTGSLTGMSGQLYWSADTPSALEPSWSMVFDGGDDAVTISSPPTIGTDNVTVTFWIKPDASATGTNQGILDAYDSQLGFDIGIDETNDHIVVGRGTGITNQWEPGSDGELTDDAWQFVVCQLDRSSGIADGLQVYIDDMTTAAWTADITDTNGVDWGTGASSWLLGKRTGGGTLTGKLAGVRVFQSVLSSSDRSALKSGSVPSAAVLCSYIHKSTIWPTGSNSVRMDCVGSGNRFAVIERGMTREPYNRWNEDLSPYYDWNASEQIGVYDVSTPFGTISFAAVDTIINKGAKGGQIGIINGASNDTISIQTYESPRLTQTHTPTRTRVAGL